MSHTNLCDEFFAFVLFLFLPHCKKLKLCKGRQSNIGWKLHVFNFSRVLSKGLNILA